MKVRITECSLPVGHTKADLEKKICRTLRIRSCGEYEIVRHSIDARRKPDLYDVYTIDVTVKNPQEVIRRAKSRLVSAADSKDYRFPFPSEKSDRKKGERPVIVGSGPAGLFCALMLSRSGLRPIVLERGEQVEARKRSVEEFWKSGRLNPSSNVQFGEGGAGTFSDGKLNTGIRDPDGKIRFVLKEFVKAGADPSILYEARPHIGTDVLSKIVRNLRLEIESEGGEVRFDSCLTSLKALPDPSGRQGRRYLLFVNDGADPIETGTLILAIGHSARDTYRMLYDFKIQMEPKAFAVGLRVEHPQAMINQAMYGSKDPGPAGPAPYRLTHQCADGRGVYSFCMCPGGYVVNASSEPGRTAVNGMSYSGRSGSSANAAIVVTVAPDDYKRWQKSFGDFSKEASDALLGIAFQRMLEERAYACAAGLIPVQRFFDFTKNIPSAACGSFMPQIKGGWALGSLRGILPEECNASIIEGMHAFARTIPGFDDPDVLLSGVESRTSSPVRILRNKSGECLSFPGIYPCGEGAGYAGGIISAAVDGIRTAEAVVKKSMYISTHLC